MLELLRKYRVLSSRQLYYLAPGTGLYEAFHKIAKGQQRCNDRIRILYDLHCVNKFSPPLAPGEGTSVQYVWLDRAGAKLLGADEFRRRKTLPMDYLHTSAIIDVYCQLVAQHRAGMIQLKYMAIERLNKTWPLIPDLLFILRMSGRGYPYIVEVDRCEKKEKDELEKIASYNDWRLSNQWLREDWSGIMPSPRFPRIIYAFDDKKSRWQARAKKFQGEADRLGLKLTTCKISELASTCEQFASP